MRRSVTLLLALIGLAALAIWGSAVSTAGTNVGSFEIEGDTTDSPAGGPIDWNTPPPNLTTFTDDTLDTQFGGGAKWDQQGTWSCNTGAVPAKSDITNGAISFRTLNGSQFVYVNFTRVGTTGSANVDYEFNQQATPVCADLPQRTVGDIVIAFDQSGNDPALTRVLQWNGAGFTQLQAGTMGTLWDAAVSGDRRFGEAALNISAILNRTIGCGDFATVHMDSRSSDAINAALQDRTTAKPVNLGSCPASSLKKEVRNVTTGGSFADTASASAGDVIEYRFTYENKGGAAANDVVVSDEVPAGTVLQPGCGCSVNGDQLSWSLGTVEGGGNRQVSFQVKLPASFPQSTTQIKNTGSVDTSEESPKSSNETTVNVTAAPNSVLEKTARNDTTGAPAAKDIAASPGDQVTYIFKYTNSGTSPAHGVKITDTVPANTTFVSGDGCTASGTAVTCDLGTVDAGQSKTVSFTVKLAGSFPTGTTVIKNTGKVTTTEEGEKPSNEATVTVGAAAKLSLKKSADRAEVAPGDQIKYTLDYANEGNGDATDVKLTEPIPAGTKFVSCDPTCDQTGDPVTSVSWDVGTLAGGAKGSVTLVVEVLAEAGATVCNTAELSSAQTGSTPVKSNEVCVGSARPNSVLEKTSRNDTTGAAAGKDIAASPGDQITYLFKYTNSGTGPATNVTITDTLPANTTFVGGNGCTLSDATVTCALGTVNGGESKTVSFTVTLADSFPTGSTVITNTGKVTTTEEGEKPSNPSTVTVTAEPDLTLAKSSDQPDGAVVAEGDQISYTLAYANEGDGDATDVTVTEPIPAGTTLVDCEPDCDIGNGSVSWDVGTVAGGGGGGSLTLVVKVLNAVGCAVCNTATIGSPDQDQGATVNSNQVCVAAQPSANPAGAHANGDAMGIHVSDTRLNLNVTQGKVMSSQSGVGADSASDSVVNLAIPGTGTLATARVLGTSSTSTVTPNPARASHTSTSEVADLNLVAGLVRARTARAVATASATGQNSTVSSGGTSFSDLIVNGQRLNHVSPNTKVGLPKALFGPGSYVALREELANTSGPPHSQLSGGTYAADLEVNLIRVHITDLLPLLPGKQATEIVVGHAKAHADFPQTRLCAERAQQSVSGHAYVAAEATNPDLLPAIVGFTGIGPQGGDHTTSLEKLTLPGDGSVVSAAAVDARSHGELLPGVSQAGSHAQIADLCVLRAATGLCTLGATAVRAQTGSTAVPGAAASTDAGSTIVGLSILGVPVNVTAPRNTIIDLDGLGFIALNQQFCDGNIPGVPTCAGTTHSGLTERAIVLIVTVPNNPLGLRPGAAVVIGEAHSDATYIP